MLNLHSVAKPSRIFSNEHACTYICILNTAAFLLSLKFGKIQYANERTLADYLPCNTYQVFYLRIDDFSSYSMLTFRIGINDRNIT